MSKADLSWFVTVGLVRLKVYRYKQSQSMKREWEKLHGDLETIGESPCSLLKPMKIFSHLSYEYLRCLATENILPLIIYLTTRKYLVKLESTIGGVQTHFAINSENKIRHPWRVYQLVP